MMETKPNVLKKRRIALLVMVALVVISGGAGALYWAARRVPEFYLRSLAVDQDKLHQANDECLQQLTTLASDMLGRDQWEAVFTTDQINGWLAVDLVKNYPKLLPSAVVDPRVELLPNQVTLACGYEYEDIPVVVSITADIYLERPDVLALRIRGVAAGKLPLSMEPATREISKAASRLQLPLEWRQIDGDPVALITVERLSDKNREARRLDAFQIQKGQIYLAGTTRAVADTEEADGKGPTPESIETGEDDDVERQPENFGKADSDKLPSVPPQPDEAGRSEDSEKSQP